VKIILLFCLLSVGLFSCNENPKDNIKNKAKLVFKPKFDGLDAFLNYQEKIEQRQDLKTLPSLLFTHKTGYTLQSKVFLDANGEILKAIQERIDTNGVKVSTTFYFLKEVLSMVLVDKENLRRSRIELDQTRVFYDADQRPIAAYNRKLVNADPSSVFKRANLSASQHAAIQNDLNALSEMQNQEGTFALYFQGFDEAFNKKFVQFGNDSYSTNLAYAPNELVIKDLEKNPSLYTQQTFELQYQQVQEASGLQYQVLTGIKKTNATN
jgi:hypothetical protein